MNPDIALFHFLNDFADTSPPLDWLARALVNDYAVSTLLALIIGGLWFSGQNAEERWRNQRAVLFVLLGIALANVVIKLFQMNYFRPRPFATETVKLLFYRPSVSSFPSEPVATMFCFVAGVWSFNRPVARWLLFFSTAFAFARVIAGVHYPSDIVGGAIIGIVTTWLPMHWARYTDRLIHPIIRFGQRLNLA